jgi:hypothetical protein
VLPPPMLRVLVFGEGTGGGTLLFTAVLFEVVLAAFGGPPVVEFDDTGGPGGGLRGEPCNDDEDVDGEGPCTEVELCRLDDDEATPPTEPALTVEARLLLGPEEEEAGGGPGGGRRGDPCRDDDDVVPPRLERLGEVWLRDGGGGVILLTGASGGALLGDR